MQNRFEPLDENKMVKELVLETGEHVDVIQPKAVHDPPTPPLGLTRRRPHRSRLMKRTCACCPNSGDQAKEEHMDHGVYGVFEKM